MLPSMYVLCHVGLIGRDVCIEGWISPSGPLYPLGQPACLYAPLMTSLGLRPSGVLPASKALSPTVVALGVHELYWVLTRAHYSLILSLLMDNFGEAPLVVPNPSPPLPPLPFSHITPGPACVPREWARNLVVPVYFKSAVIRICEDATPETTTTHTPADNTNTNTGMKTDRQVLEGRAGAIREVLT